MIFFGLLSECDDHQKISRYQYWPRLTQIGGSQLIQTFTSHVIAILFQWQQPTICYWWVSCRVVCSDQNAQSYKERVRHYLRFSRTASSTTKVGLNTMSKTINVAWTNAPQNENAWRSWINVFHRKIKDLQTKTLLNQNVYFNIATEHSIKKTFACSFRFIGEFCMRWYFSCWCCCCYSFVDGRRREEDTAFRRLLTSNSNHRTCIAQINKLKL